MDTFSRIFYPPPPVWTVGWPPPLNCPRSLWTRYVQNSGLGGIPGKMVIIVILVGNQGFEPWIFRNISFFCSNIVNFAWFCKIFTKFCFIFRNFSNSSVHKLRGHFSGWPPSPLKCPRGLWTVPNGKKKCVIIY